MSVGRKNILNETERRLNLYQQGVSDTYVPDGTDVLGKSLKLNEVNDIRGIYIPMSDKKIN